MPFKKGSYQAKRKRTSSDPPSDSLSVGTLSISYNTQLDSLISTTQSGPSDIESHHHYDDIEGCTESSTITKEEPSSSFLKSSEIKKIPVTKEEPSSSLVIVSENGVSVANDLPSSRPDNSAEAVSNENNDSNSHESFIETKIHASQEKPFPIAGSVMADFLNPSLIIQSKSSSTKRDELHTGTSVANAPETQAQSLLTSSNVVEQLSLVRGDVSIQYDDDSTVRSRTLSIAETVESAQQSLMSERIADASTQSPPRQRAMIFDTSDEQDDGAVISISSFAMKGDLVSC
jgi:hypothetical protein